MSGSPVHRGLSRVTLTKTRSISPAPTQLGHPPFTNGNRPASDVAAPPPPPHFSFVSCLTGAFLNALSSPTCSHSPTCSPSPTFSGVPVPCRFIASLVPAQCQPSASPVQPRNSYAVFFWRTSPAALPSGNDSFYRFVLTSLATTKILVLRSPSTARTTADTGSRLDQML